MKQDTNSMLSPKEDRRHYKTSDDLPLKCNGVTFHIPSPAGTMNVIFMEDPEDDSCTGIHIHIGKAGAEISAWAHATSRILTLGLVNRTLKLNDILREWSGITTDKLVRDGGIEIRSSIEALCTAIRRYQMHKVRSDNGNSNFFAKPYRHRKLRNDD